MAELTAVRRRIVLDGVPREPPLAFESESTRTTAAMTPAPCVFDAYGTIFDLACRLGRASAVLGDDAGPVLALWRQKQLEYTWLRTLMNRFVSFDRVTEEALDFALHARDRYDPELARVLLDGFVHLTAYDDVAPALRQLRSLGHTCAILSNGTPASLASALQSSGLEEVMSHVWSASSVQRFKPDPRVYQLASDGLGLRPSQVIFVSANAWDAAGAAAFGFRAFWLNRTGGMKERLGSDAPRELSSLEQLHDALVITS